jgi:hypothetical protein
MSIEKKLKNNPVLAVIIAILLVAVLLYIFSKKPFESGAEKIKKLRKKISKDIDKLNLAKERKVKLVKKAHKLFQVIVAASIVVFFLINSVLVYLGFSFFQALEGTTLLVGSVSAISSIYVFNKLSINALFEMAENKIVLWVYKRNSFDPTELISLEDKIRSSEMEISKIQVLINS